MRIILLAVALIASAIVAGSWSDGVRAAEWSSGVTPAAEWSSAEWSSGIVKPNPTCASRPARALPRVLRTKASFLRGVKAGSIVKAGFVRSKIGAPITPMCGSGDWRYLGPCVYVPQWGGYYEWWWHPYYGHQAFPC